MAGGPRVPARVVPHDAIRLRTPVGDLSRTHLVSVILHGVLALGALGTILNALWSPEVTGVMPVSESVAGIAFCGIVVVLLVVDHFGHWQAATWGLLGVLVLGGSLLFSLASLDRVLIVTAIPVVLAAFLLRPRAAFELAALSSGCYLLVWYRHGQQPSFNFVSMLALAGVALVSWLLARRVEWLEEAEDMYRRELDRLAVERDALAAEVGELSEELRRREREVARAEPRARRRMASR